MGICFSIEEPKHLSVSDSKSKLKSTGNFFQSIFQFDPLLINQFESVNDLDVGLVGNESGASSTRLGSNNSMNLKDLREGSGYSNVDIFSYEELRLATKHFKPEFILGEGGFGVVYKGIVDNSVRTGYKSIEVAIKELNREGFQGDREWLVSSSLFTL